LAAVTSRRPRLSVLTHSCSSSTNPDERRVSALHSSSGSCRMDRPPLPAAASTHPAQHSQRHFIFSSVLQDIYTIYLSDDVILLEIYSVLVVWRSINGAGRTNEVVTLRRARLVLGWVDHFRAGIPPQYVTSHLGQLSLAIPARCRRNEYLQWFGRG